MSHPAVAEVPDATDLAVQHERHALGAMFILQRRPAELARIRATHWLAPENEHACQVVDELAARGELVTVDAFDHTSRQHSFVYSSRTFFIDCGREFEASHYSVVPEQLSQLADLVVTNAAKRQIDRGLQEQRARLGQGIALADVLASIDREVEHARQATAQPGDVPPLAADIAPALWAQPFPPAIPSGFSQLDILLGDGLRNDTILAAGTGQGKTGIAIQIGTFVAQRHPVCYFTTELSRRQGAARFAAPRLGRSWSDVLGAGPDTGTVVAAALADLDLRIFEVRDVQEIFTVLRDLTAHLKRPIFSIVDYIQGLARGAEADRRLVMGALSDAFVRMSRETGSASLIVSATARGMYHGNADKSAGDFIGAAKESGDLEYDAANVLFLDVDPCPMGGTSSGRLHLAKSRFGVQGTIGLRFDGARGTFVEDVLGSMTDEQRDVYDAISDGANTYADVAKVVERRKQDVCRIVGVLERRGIIGTRPLRIGGTP